MIIDIFSKFGWVAPLKTKSGDAEKSALETILLKLPLLRSGLTRGQSFIIPKLKIYSQNTKSKSIQQKTKKSVQLSNDGIEPLKLNFGSTSQQMVHTSILISYNH